MPDTAETPPTDSETPPTDVPPLDDSSSLPQQTLALGGVLKDIAEADPSGTPSESAAAAFASWLAEAGPGSHKSAYFADVRDNYVVRDNTNKDLFDLFDLLGKYAPVEEEEPPQKTFIGLPLIGG